LKLQSLLKHDNVTYELAKLNLVIKSLNYTINDYKTKQNKTKKTIVESFTLFSIVDSIFEGGGLEQCKLSCHSCHIFPNF
jgi:hypothetical protein